MSYRHGSAGVPGRLVEADKVFGAHHEARTHTFVVVVHLIVAVLDGKAARPHEEFRRAHKVRRAPNQMRIFSGHPKRHEATHREARRGTVLTVGDRAVVRVDVRHLELRENAAVLGYNPQGEIVKLREGKNELICLANNPNNTRFSVACYHRDLEPYMARDRELLAQKITGHKRDDIRWKEVSEGKLSLPREPRTLYVLTGTGFDATTNQMTDAYLRWVIYKSDDRCVLAMGHLCALCHAGVHRAIDEGKRQRALADESRYGRSAHHDQSPRK